MRAAGRASQAKGKREKLRTAGETRERGSATNGHNSEAACRQNAAKKRPPCTQVTEKGGEGRERQGGRAELDSPPSCTASKRVPAQGLSTPAKCTRGAPRHSIPLFKRRKPRSGRKRARRQGRSRQCAGQAWKKGRKTLPDRVNNHRKRPVAQSWRPAG